MPQTRNGRVAERGRPTGRERAGRGRPRLVGHRAGFEVEVGRDEGGELAAAHPGLMHQHGHGSRAHVCGAGVDGQRLPLPVAYGPSCRSQLDLGGELGKAHRVLHRIGEAGSRREKPQAGASHAPGRVGGGACLRGPRPQPSTVGEGEVAGHEDRVEPG